MLQFKIPPLYAGFLYYTLYLLLSAFVDAINRYLTSVLGYSPLQSLCWRYLLAFFLILPILFHYPTTLRQIIYMPEKLKQILKPFFMFLLSLSAVGSLAFVPMSTYSIAQQIVPLVTVVVCAYLLKEKLTKLQIAIFGVAIFGSIIEASEVQFSFNWGLGFLIFYIGTVVAFLVASRLFIARSLPAMVSLFFFFFVLGFFSLMLTPFISLKLIAWWHFFVFLLLAGFSFFQQLSFFRAITLTPLSQLSILSFFSPLLVAFLGALLYGEPLSLTFLLAALIVILSAIAMVFSPLATQRFYRRRERRIAEKARQREASP